VLDAWTREVETLTRPYREGRARELAATAAHKRELARRVSEARVQLSRAVAPEATHLPYSADIENAGRWHRQRARGQRERFERVDGCRRFVGVQLLCEACGTFRDEPARCRTALACTSCRGKIAYEKIAKLSRSRQAALRYCAKRGLLRHNRQGGRWSEKLTTLTVPHLQGHDIGGRIGFARECWRRFGRAFRKWLSEHPDNVRKKSTGKRTEAILDPHGHLYSRWLKNHEWTPGDDNRGHPHFHMWFLGPWLPRDLLSTFWRDAMIDASRDDPGCAHMTEEDRARVFQYAIVDVRQCKPGPSALREVIKYLFLDLLEGDGGRTRLPPEQWAQVYEAFDGTRSTQGSPGLMLLAKREAGEAETGAQCPCGAVGCWRVTRRDYTLAERLELELGRRKPGLRYARPAAALVQVVSQAEGKDLCVSVEATERPYRH
jgi:hypothetical protein